MKCGLLARSEQRGLGTMSLEFFRHVKPEKTLVVIPAGVGKHGLTSHTDWYPGAEVARYDGQLPYRQCQQWLDGLDVVYAAETFYDWRFCQWANAMHVRTVVHAMPEFCSTRWAASPSRWWAPTSWRLDKLPPGTVHVPVPIATDRFTPRERKPGPFRWLHVAGAQTDADRNGTNAVMAAARLLTEEQTIVIHSQTPGIGYGPTADCVNVEHVANVDNYWDIYDADAVVMPRRYAGLSLPVLESFGAGLPVLMTDMAPQNVDWPVETVATNAGPTMRMIGGHIPTGDADPYALAEMMDRWVTTPDLVRKWRDEAKLYADEHSWDRWAARYRELLAA